MHDRFQASGSSLADPWVCPGSSTLPGPRHTQQFPLLQPATSLPFLCHLHLLFMTSRLCLGSALKLVVHLKESRCQAVGRR